MIETVSVIGLGYIGLPTATLLASRKIKVVGVDVSAGVVDTINQGKIHIVEPELDILVHAVVTSGYLRAAMVPESADVFLISVPTPLTDDYKPDLSYIKSAARSIAPVLTKGNLVIIESTSPVGTSERLAGWLAGLRSDLSFPHQADRSTDVHIVYCPERVMPGSTVYELVANDRVIGGMTERCSELAVEFYKQFVEGECIITDVRTAEMCKLAENSFRDVNIAFANELSMICDRLDIDVWELIRLANRHPRVDILQPGCGVGGHCISVDPWFVVDSAPEEAQLIQTARRVNDTKPDWVLHRIEQAVTELTETEGLLVENVRIACLGLTFKSDSDDLRESPALQITQTLSEGHVGEVCVVDPNLQELPAIMYNPETRLMGLDEAIEWAHVVVLLVDHAQFKSVEPQLSKRQVLIDTRGIWKGDLWMRHRKNRKL